MAAIDNIVLFFCTIRDYQLMSNKLQPPPPPVGPPTTHMEAPPTSPRNAAGNVGRRLFPLLSLEAASTLPLSRLFSHL